MSRAWTLGHASVFVLWLSLPLVANLVEPDRASSAAENRNLAQWRSLPDSVDAIPTWLDDFTAYIRDQVGFREPLTIANARVLWAIGTSPNVDVVLGRKGFLFERTINRRNDYLEESFGTLLLADAQVEALVDRLAENARRAEVAGIVYLPAFVPNKSIIYRKRLPKRYARLISEDRMLAQVNRRAAARGVPLLDLTSAIGAAAQERLTWLRQDTHWNAAGAWAAYRAIADELNAMAGQPLLPLSDKDVRFKKSRSAEGDLVKLLGLYGYLSETIAVPVLTNPAKVVRREERMVGPRLSGLFVETDAANDLRIMILADSFVWKIFPFLMASSKNILWIRNSDQTVPWDEVEDFKPDVLLSLNIEKGLIHRKDDF